jgi:hypothetical protein
VYAAHRVCCSKPDEQETIFLIAVIICDSTMIRCMRFDHHTVGTGCTARTALFERPLLSIPRSSVVGVCMNNPGHTEHLPKVGTLGAV